MLFIEPPVDAGPMDDIDKWEVTPIVGVHYPECNAGCDRDSHYLRPDGPQGSAFSHQPAG